MKKWIICICLVVSLSCFFGCGSAAPAQDGTTPNAVTVVKKESQTVPATTSPQQTEIVETPEVVITVEAQLRATYEEMGLPNTVVDALAQCHVEFVVPEQFTTKEAVTNELWQYDYGLEATSGKVEIRFKVIPGDIKSNPEKSAKATIANELMNTLIRLNGANLVSDMQDHPKTEASSRFNADGYTTGTFQPVSEFSDKSIASAGIFYKQGVGRVIVISLMDDLSDETTRTEWITGANALRFAESQEK